MTNHEIDQRIIKTIGDYCFRNDAPCFSSDYSLYLAPLVVKDIAKGMFSFASFKKYAKLRGEFFIANDLNVEEFCKGLFEAIKKELGFFTCQSFKDSILEFKRKVENGNYRGFEKEKVSEDTLRSTLCVALQEETFCEARSSSGQSDIIVPAERVIIETKLWRGQEVYNAGLPELCDYLDKANYATGYYIVFDYSKSKNSVVEQYGESFELNINGKQIIVVFVLMNRESPSKLYLKAKRQNKQLNT